MKDLQIPVLSNGNVLSYLCDWELSRGVVSLKSAWEFTGQLKYVQYLKGTSSLTFIWEDKNGIRYPMFMSEFDKVLQQGVIQGKILEGKFGFIKRGANYSITKLD